METSRDFADLFKTLNAFRIRYLVVGAHAVAYYSTPRFTKDLDVWVPPELNDEKKVFEALARFGAPMRGLSPGDFADSRVVFQVGVAPVRVDVMMGLEGVDPRRAWKNRVRTSYGRTRMNIIGRADLIRSKKAAGRPQDRLDLKRLIIGPGKAG